MDTWLVVGLGNPGPGYAGNRHNVGAMVVDELAARASASLRSHKARAVASEVRLGVLPGGAPGPRAVIATPLSYMNESGGPVAGLMSFYKIPVERLIVVHDELDIPFASVRLKRGGGEGGHNGLRSISKSLGTRDYLRVRVGIGRPPGGWTPPPSSSRTSPPPSGPSCRSCSRTAPTPPSGSSPWASRPRSRTSTRADRGPSAVATSGPP